MNKYEPDEILNLAIMSKTPYVIVEGVDDVRIYEEISRTAGVQCEIYSVEMLDGIAGGNDGVIDAMGIVESLSMPNGKSANQFVVGIIDCDARYYRNEMPTLASIFSLNAYSIESHFVSKSAIKPSIDKITRISSREEVDIDSIYQRIESNMFDIYYFSLDALKKAVDKNYNSIVGFSASAGRRKDRNTIYGLMERKDDLDIFAATFQLGRDIESLKKFVKGKWLLTAFSEELFKEIDQLVKNCKSSSIKQCSMCELDDAAPCLYQLRDGFNKNSLYSTLKDFVDMSDFDYIREKFRSLSLTAAQI